MEDNTRKGNRKRNKKKLSKKQKIVISILSVLGIIILCAGLWFWNVWNDIYSPIEENNETKQTEYQVVEGITNVLLLGTDGRTLDENSRSDSMIIATLDANQQKVRLTSLYRDTLVEIPGYGRAKLNAAYAYGGHELLMQTIQENFGIKLDKYIAINFWGFENVINEIGGIEVDVTENEIDELNKFIGESTGGRTSPLITEPGLQKLDGQQALSYARIRKNDSAYNRDSRQQEVLKIVATQLKTVNPIKYPFLLNAMKDEIKTNITPDLAFSLAYTIYKFPVLEIQQLAMPLRDAETSVAAFEGRLFMNQGWVILTDLPQMGELMRKFIFEGVVPTLDDVDYNSLNSVLANYRAEEQRYNSVNGINPEDYASEEDKEKEDIQSGNNSSGGSTSGGSTNGGGSTNNDGSTNNGGGTNNDGGTNGGGSSNPGDGTSSDGSGTEGDGSSNGGGNQDGGTNTDQDGGSDGGNQNGNNNENQGGNVDVKPGPSPQLN